MPCAQVRFIVVGHVQAGQGFRAAAVDHVAVWLELMRCSCDDMLVLSLATALQHVLGAAEAQAQLLHSIGAAGVEHICGVVLDAANGAADVSGACAA